jgi:hypothetical protein
MCTGGQSYIYFYTVDSELGRLNNIIIDNINGKMAAALGGAALT